MYLAPGFSVIPASHGKLREQPVSILAAHLPFASKMSAHTQKREFCSTPLCDSLEGPPDSLRHVASRAGHIHGPAACMDQVPDKRGIGFNQDAARRPSAAGPSRTLAESE